MLSGGQLFRCRPLDAREIKCVNARVATELRRASLRNYRARRRRSRFYRWNLLSTLEKRVRPSLSLALQSDALAKLSAFMVNQRLSTILKGNLINAPHQQKTKDKLH